jgi:dienelactone hydrolase
MCAVVALAAPAAAGAFDGAAETQNYAKIRERMQYVTLTPEFQQRLIQANTENEAEAAQIPVNDPERDFSGNICANGGNECAGDVRYYDWKGNGFGIVEPVLVTARNGSTISGRIWATQQGPAQRPAVVITTGSVQAPERLYWGTAATLAKHGYVVLTYDTQGQGRSDTYGEGADRFDGFPSQEGRPFYDGTEDALDFLLSTPAHPYDPRPSCTTGTDHSEKQDRRVAAGLDAAYNPLAGLVDPSRVGIAGHSLGAGAVSYIGQVDDRVDAIAAWDNLSAPTTGPECLSGSAPRPTDPPITKPALGISNDYGLTPTPYNSDPDPEGKTKGFVAYKDAGIDSMEFVIRGGTHYESSFIPGMTTGILGTGTLRGTDMVAWYTTAWFDKYVKCADGSECEADADRRLLTDRWRDDARGGEVDVAGDPNLYSFYLRSRFDIRDSTGAERTCDDMRTGCPTMGPDGLAAGYDHVSDAYTAPADSGPSSESGGDSGAAPCALPQTGTDAKDTPATLVPSGSGDAIRGAGGDDRLRGRDGDDCLYGEDGNDRLGGDAGADKLKGGAGNDRLKGGDGPDVLGGGPGADVLKAKDGERDKLKCGPGRDRVRADRRDKLGRGC